MPAKETAIATLVIPRRGRFPRPVIAVPAPAIAWTVAAALLWLLVGPRIELPLVRGLRVEDLVFALLAVLCLLHVRRPGLPSGPTLAIAGVAVTGLVSAAVAIGRGTVDPLPAVLFAVRPAEYWIAFPAALLMLRAAPARWSVRTDRLLVVVTVLQTAFAVLQYYFSVPIGFSHAAYTRAAGLTVGPYELGAISAALVVYWVAHTRFVLASAALIALAASISRVSVLSAAVALAILGVALIVVLVRRVRRLGRAEAFRIRVSLPRLAVQAVAVVASGLVLAFTLGILTLPQPSAPVAAPAPVASEPPADEPTPTPTPTPTASADAAPIAPVVPEESVATRIASTSVLGSWDVAGGLADAAPRVVTSGEYQDIAYSRLNEFVNAANAAQAGAEPSNLVRFFRWHLILRTIDDPVDVAVGLGPSFVGPSVDGSYLRFFADGGVLGVLAWLALIVAWLRRGPLWMRCVTISLLVGASFIDIVYAQRPMVLFWLLLALAAARQTAAAAQRAAVDGGADRPAPVEEQPRAGERVGSHA